MQNHKAIKHFVTVLVPGLSPDMFGVSGPEVQQPIRMQAPEKLPFFEEAFGMTWPTRAPGDRTSLFPPWSVFVEVPMSNNEIKKLRQKTKNAPKEANLDLLEMTFEQLKEQSYPIHPDTSGRADDAEILPDGWVDVTDTPDHSPRVYGLDCEMCVTKNGSEVTRVTLVENETRETVLDELVKPYDEIIDYVTTFSGITQEMMENVETRLPDVQKRLLELISTKDILVGHSLESDLYALKIRHPKIIDTSMIFHHPRGPPYKAGLKMLTSKYLKRDIQSGTNGHDSAEDANACLDLLAAKLGNGMEYGTVKKHNVDLATRLSQANKTVAIVDYGVPRWHNEKAKAVISCTNDDEVVDNAIKCARTHDFVYTNLRELRVPAGWRTTTKDGVEVTSSEESLDECLEKLNARLSRLYKGLPENTALMIWSGHGNPTEMSRLQKKRKAFNEEYKIKKWDELENSWTENDNQSLVNATKIARSGVSFLTVKGEPTDEPDDENTPMKRAKSED
jgi:RNA exonuclease 1